MCLKLTLLHQIHYPGDASECESAIGHQRNRCMKFQRRIGGHLDWMTNIDWRNQCKALQQGDQRRRERAHEGETVGWADQHVDEGYRPGEKDKDLKHVRQGTASQRMTADRQKRRLKNKSESNREKIKSSWSKNSGAQSDRGARDCREKTHCRNDEKISIHSKETYCKSRLPAWQFIVSLLPSFVFPKGVPGLI